MALRAALMQRQPEEQIVDRRHLAVDTFDERRLEGDRRQRAGRRVGAREFLVVVLFSRKEQRHTPPVRTIYQIALRRS